MLVMMGLVVVCGLAAGAGGWLLFRGKPKVTPPPMPITAPSRAVPVARPSPPAEIQAQTSQAATLVKQGQYDAADKILASFASPPESSTDAIFAYRGVGEWLALQGRWPEAASRYGSLLRLEKPDDWNTVSLDYHACAAALAESGDRTRYDQMCQAAIAQFGTTGNGDLAGRIIKVCLLLPANEATMAQLQPLMGVADKAFSPNAKFSDWAVIPLCLYRYRHGDYSQAITWCQRVENRNKGSAIEATTLIIGAMSNYHLGKLAEASAKFERGRQIIQARLQQDWKHGNSSDGIWYDWAFAQILLREASDSIGKN